jgi:hypothetical protein
MLRLHSRIAFRALAACALVAATHAYAIPVTVNYTIAGTGQTASARFEFVNGSMLQITLAETTPAGTSSLNGGGAILTSLGFLLPRVQIVGGSVTVAPGSTSAGFAGDPGGGADVSNLWGYTPTTLSAALQANSADLAAAAAAQSALAAEQDAIAIAKRARAKAQRDAAAQLLANNPDPQMKADAADLIKAAERDEADAAIAGAARDAANTQAAALQSQANDFAARATAAPTLQLVGALWDPLTAFLDSSGSLFNGLDGGLLGDVLARGGERIITNSVLLSLNLSDALLAIEQEQFLASLRTGSFVGYGSGGFLDGRPDGLPPVSVPEPSTSALMVALLVLSGSGSFVRRQRRAANLR